MSRARGGFNVAARVRKHAPGRPQTVPREIERPAQVVVDGFRAGVLCYAATVEFEKLLALLRAFEQARVRYAVFGAVALNLHGLARFTEDLDVFVAPEADNIERLKVALRSVFDDPAIEQIAAEEMLGAYPAVQYVPPEGTYHIDLVTRLGEAFAFSDLETQRVPFGDLTVTVVSARTLYRMKKGTMRLKDRADAELIRQRFHLKDE